MHKSQLLLTLSLIWGFLTIGARADIDIGVSGDDNGIKEFHLAISDYYRVPDTQVTILRGEKLSDEELPVIFFLAQKTRVAPNDIVNLRLGGKSWMDITYYYGMGADIYYVPVKTVTVPPYSKACGLYKTKRKKEWKYIKLADDDVVNLVNLKFISAHYGYSTDQVIKMRSEGKSFMAINKDFKDHKEKSSLNNEESHQKIPNTGAEISDRSQGKK